MRSGVKPTVRNLVSAFGNRRRAGRAATAAPTRMAPHVRDAFSLDRAMRYMLVALVPSIVMGLINAGFQANADMALAGIESAPNWRVVALDALGVGHDPASFLAAVAHGALYFIPVLAVTIVIGGLWEGVFARFRNRPPGGDLLVTALLFTLILPPSIPLWQAALGITFAIVVGKEIFGGTGRNFLNPALTGLAFLYVTYPKEMIGETGWTVVDAFTTPTYPGAGREGPGFITWLDTSWQQSFLGLVPGPFGTTSTLACLIGAVFLLYTRVVSARIIVGILTGMIATVLVINQFGDPAEPFVGLTWSWHLVLGGFAFGAVFLATDPVSSAMTNKGRWIYGLLIGVMVVVIRVASSNHPDGVMFAILFGNIFAPLIDYTVVWANIRQRARRNGR